MRAATHQHTGALAVRLGVAEDQERQRERFAAATPTAEEEVRVLGRLQHEILKRRRLDLLTHRRCAPPAPSDSR
jgi:hypothetical protein